MIFFKQNLSLLNIENYFSGYWDLFAKNNFFKVTKSLTIF